MATKSTIEWTQLTWNPVTGCTKISSGCKNCYAERMAKRLRAMGVPQYKDGFELSLAPHTLTLPYSWRSPKLVFVNSMSDLFHSEVPLGYIQRVFKVMNESPRHTYQILTKRAERLAQIADKLHWGRNIWMGVSVESERWSHRIDALKQVPAARRFISFEPLIDEVKSLNLQGIHWVIVGGESGPNARPMKEDWVLRIQQRAKKLSIPFFFKQWGVTGNNTDPSDPTSRKDHHFYAKGGCLLRGELYREMPCPADSSRRPNTAIVAINGASAIR